MQYIPIAISILALAISALTLWLTHLRTGKLKMTKPTVIFFGPDGGDSGLSKLFLRTLLYSTSNRGIVLEHLYVRLTRGETRQNFNIWVYGEKDLARGSGLYVGHNGVATNHHFLLPNDTVNFKFSAGEYRLDVFAKIVGREPVELLSSIDLKIDPSEAEKLDEEDCGIYFDWGPDASQYQKKIEGRRSPPTDALRFLEALRDGSAVPDAAGKPTDGSP